MASALSTEKLTAQLACYAFEHDPADSTVATEIGWVDMRDFQHFLALAMSCNLTGTGITAFSIVANAESDGSGTDVIVKTHAVGTAPDAGGDFLVLECTAEEIAQLAEENSVALRYVTAKVTCNNAADEAAVFYVRGGAKHARSGLTADYTA